MNWLLHRMNWGDHMMVTALSWALALVAVLALLGVMAARYGVDSRDSFIDDRR